MFCKGNLGTFRVRDVKKSEERAFTGKICIKIISIIITIEIRGL